MKYTDQELKEIQINIGLNSIPLDDEEREILEDMAKGLYIPVENQEEEKEKLKQAVINTTQKRKAISIKPLENDIFKIKVLALEK
jgi:cell division ATPase FtsA